MNSTFLTPDELRALALKACGENVLIHRTAVLVNCSTISIGDHVRIDPFAVISVSGGMTIGDHVHISGHCMFTGSAVIEMQDYSGVSQGTKVLSSTDDYSGPALTNPTVPSELRSLRTEAIIIGRHVVVGANCVVLPGGSIGEGASVGALSLVKAPLAPWMVYAGVPARPVKERDRHALVLEQKMKSRIESLSR